MLFGNEETVIIIVFIQLGIDEMLYDPERKLLKQNMIKTRLKYIR